MAEASNSARGRNGRRRNVSGSARLLVRQIRSPIGRKRHQRMCLIGLGLNKLQRSRVLPDTPQVRGMIRQVRHLVQLQEISQPADSST